MTNTSLLRCSIYDGRKTQQLQVPGIQILPDEILPEHVKGIDVVSLRLDEFSAAKVIKLFFGTTCTLA